MSKRNILLISICVVGVILIYVVDLFKLNYRMEDWREFSGVPVTVSHIQYLIADTPEIIGYTDHTLGKKVSCAQSVVYVETDVQENYRCCDTGEEISCLKGDFSSDIPAMDEQCIAILRNSFGAAETLPSAKEYQLYGTCSGGRDAELTVVQLAPDGKILWKYLKMDSIRVVSTVLRCVIAPALIALILYLLYRAYQERTVAPVRRI